MIHLLDCGGLPNVTIHTPGWAIGKVRQKTSKHVSKNIDVSKNEIGENVTRIFNVTFMETFYTGRF